ncbi:MAG: pantoate kinase [Thermoplasmata archaeon]
MGSKASAFCPGHVTAFFEICENEDILKKGSRGAGLCLSKGVITRVEVEAAEKLDIIVKLDGNRTEDSVTELALRKMLDNEKLRIMVESENQLPVSQGFGMSGAGSLSSVTALNKALGSSRSMVEQMQIAHTAEVESGTGLGDVHPQALGGMDIRRRPGAPPFGEIEKQAVEEELVLCVLGEKIRTKDLLQDEETVQRINRFGSDCIESIVQTPTLERLFSLGRDFSIKSGLASERIVKAIEECEAYGSAGMSMLGNSVFAIGDTDNLAKTLERYGIVIECRVENLGVRAI